MLPAAQTNDAATFGKIVDQYQSGIMRYLFRLTGDLELAKDLTQDTFVRAFKNISRTGDDLQVKAWLYRIATNNAMQYYRRKKILPFLRLNDRRTVNSSDSGRESGNVIEKIAVRDALRRIPPHQRSCLLLHFVEGFKYREIAGTLGISEDAVRMRVARGQQAFRKYYEGETK